MDGAASLQASVIVRAFNRAATIGTTIDSLRMQSQDVEIIVVDSGSTDGTLEIAQARADQLLQITPEQFSFGHALNLGAAAAHGDVHFALSAHCAASTRTWIADSLKHYADDAVAGTSGAMTTPEGHAIQTAYRPTLEEALRYPFWGFSNHASSWRASTWRQHPFNEELLACEDKEWSWRVLGAGWRVCFDPALCVPATHRRGQGLRATWRRARIEAKAYTEMGFPPVPDFWGTARLWWTDFSAPSAWPPLIRRLNPHRAAEFWGAYAGSRTRTDHDGSVLTRITRARD